MPCKQGNKLSKLNLAITADERKDAKQLKKIDPYCRKLPYKEKTAFGYVTLFDPRQSLNQTVFQEESGIPFMGLDEAENVALDYLIKGRYYASTGTIQEYNITRKNLTICWQKQPKAS